MYASGFESDNLTFFRNIWISFKFTQRALPHSRSLEMGRDVLCSHVRLHEEFRSTGSEGVRLVWDKVEQKRVG